MAGSASDDRDDSYDLEHLGRTRSAARSPLPDPDHFASSAMESLLPHSASPVRPMMRRHETDMPSRGFSLVSLKRLFFQETSRSMSHKRYDEFESRDEKAQRPRGFKLDARIISDATIGLSDGLTVPFALTAGLSALGNTNVVIYGGLAELIAGAISMGLGGYLGAKSEEESYFAARSQTERLIARDPRAVQSSIHAVFEPFDIPAATLNDLFAHLADSPKLVDFLMQFQHCAEAPAGSRAVISAITIALGYFFGGLLPLMPYFFVGQDEVYQALYISIAVMVLALFAFGYVKTCIVSGWSSGANIRSGCYSGVQMVIVGSAAAAAAMGLVRLFNQDNV